MNYQWTVRQLVFKKIDPISKLIVMTCNFRWFIDSILLLPRGGKIYQVLREPTLSLHPNSLLTQLAEDQKDDKPIFVEGLGGWLELPDELFG